MIRIATVCLLVITLSAALYSPAEGSISTHEELMLYLESVESADVKVSPARVADEIIIAIRQRIHFGTTLPNGVEFTNPLQRTMIMYLISNPAVKKWIELEKAGVRKAIRMINDNDEETVITALFVLGRSGNVTEPDITAIEKVMKGDKRWVVRNRAVLALHELGRTALVKKALDDSNWNVRLLAVRAIGSAGDFDGLIDAINSETQRQKKTPDDVHVWGDGPRYWVLRGAAHELKMNRWERRLEEIAKNDPEPLNRLNAVTAFSWMEESGVAWHNLIGALSDEDAFVRATAVRGIGAQRWVTRDLRDIVKSLADKDTGVRKAAIDTFLLHWNPLMIRHIAPLLEDADVDTAYAAACTIIGLRHEIHQEHNPFRTGQPEDLKKSTISIAKEIYEQYAEALRGDDLYLLDFLAPPDLPDLDLLYVQLTPEYQWSEEKVRPDDGEDVVWIAHVENKGTQPTGSFEFTITVNGLKVHSAEHGSLQPGELVQLNWETKYAFDNNWIAFSLDPVERRDEITKHNNTLTFRENSITAGYWVEEARRQHYDKIQAYFRSGANSYEDWQQRNLAFWNASMRRSVYLLMPEGALEDIRAQKIVRLPDGALPLSGGLSGNNPDRSDHSVDVMWGFPGHDIEKAHPFAVARWDAFPWLEASLHHEMSHARYLVDFYGLNMRGEDVEVRLPSGRRLFPPTHDNLHYTEQGIIMKSGYFAGFAEAHSAAYGRILSRRAIQGAWNAPGNIGEYLSDLPSSTTFRILDSDGKPLAGAVVDIYQSINDQRLWDHRTGFYDRQMDDTPDISGVADANGLFTTDRQVFSGGAISGYLGNTYILLFIRHGGQYDRRFYDITQFNMPAWENGFGNVEFEFITNISTNNVDVPVIISGSREEKGFALEWTPVGTKYDVLIKNGNYDWDVFQSGLTDSRTIVPGFENREYSIVAYNQSGQKSARSEPFRIPPNRRPRRIILDAYGDRYVLNHGLDIYSPTIIFRGSLHRYTRGAADIDVAPDGTIATLAPDDKRKVDGVDIDLKNRVMVINNNSYTRWFSGDDEVSRLIEPKGVAITPEGRVYVASTGSKDIVMFDAEGKAVDRFGREGEGDSEFMKPVDIDYHPSGLVAVVDEEQGRIQVFDGDGNFIRSIDGLTSPRAVAFDNSGNVYAVTTNGITVCNPDGEILSEIEEYGGEPLNDVLDIAVGLDGEIVFIRQDREVIYKLPSVSGFSVRLLVPEYLVKETTSQIVVQITNDTDKTVPVPEVTIQRSDGTALLTLEPSKKEDAGAGTSVIYTGLLKMEEGIVSNDFIRMEISSERKSVSYLPMIQRKTIEIIPQVNRAKRESQDSPERFNITAVIDNFSDTVFDTKASISGLVGGAAIVSSKGVEAKIQPRSRTISDFIVELDTSVGLFATPAVLNVNTGTGIFHREIPLDSPLCWKLFGPIPAKVDDGYSASFPPEERIDFNETFEKDGIIAKWFDLPIEWMVHDGIAFLQDNIKPSSDVGIYAYTVLISETECDAQLRYGTDDTITAWFNGVKVISKKTLRGVKIDEDIVPVRMKKGANTVLLKVWQGGGGWGFIMRVTNPEGNIIPGLRCNPDYIVE